MLTQYDTIIPDSDLYLIDENFNEINLNNIDGSFPVDPNMGDNHISDFVFFGKTKWWNYLFQSTSVEEFYNLTFPNWSVEEYYYKKCMGAFGTIKFKVRTNLEEWEEQYYREYPSNWIRDNIDCNTRDPFNLFFPDLILTDSSNSWETPVFDIEKSLLVSIRPINGIYQIFVWNKLISEHDRIINVNISLSTNFNCLNLDEEVLLNGDSFVIVAKSTSVGSGLQKAKNVVSNSSKVVLSKQANKVCIEPYVCPIDVS